MAGSKVTIKTTLKASTIMEVLIAMILIIAVFGIAMMIFTNVLNSSLSIKKIKAQAILQEALLNAEKTTNTVSQSISIDDFRIDQEIKPYNGNMALIDIHLSAFDSNQQKIADLEKVILNKND